MVGRVLHQEHSPDPVSLEELLTMLFLMPADLLAPKPPWLRGWDAREPGPPQPLCVVPVFTDALSCRPEFALQFLW